MFFFLCLTFSYIAATAVDNGKGGGYEKFNGMNAAVKIQGRTYHFLANATQGHGLNYFTFENEAGVLQHASEIQSWKTKKEKVETNKAIGCFHSFFEITCIHVFCSLYIFLILSILFYLTELFSELKRHNAFAQECSMVGKLVDRDVGSGMRFADLHELRAQINVSTRTLEVGTIISDEASGGPLIIKYQLKGSTKFALQTSNLVEPLVYPLFFPYGELGWGAELSKDFRWNK